MGAFCVYSSSMTESSADTQEADVAALKAARKNGLKPTSPRRSVLSQNRPAPDSPSAMSSAMRRVMPVLFDPAEIPIVVSSSGMIPSAVLNDRYVRAEVAFSEVMTPAGCTSQIAVSRWHAGDWVRKDVYAAWANEYATTEDAT
jgi:hypothetical protein